MLSENSKQKASVLVENQVLKAGKGPVYSLQKAEESGFSDYKWQRCPCIAQNNGDKALLLRGLDDEDGGTTVLKTNKKRSFGFDAQNYLNPWQKTRLFIFQKALPFSSV